MSRKSFKGRFLFVSVIFVMLFSLSLPAMATTEEGLKALSIGKYEKAEALFNEVLKGDPEDPQAGYYLGISLLMQERFDEALDVFEKLNKNINNKAVMEDYAIPTKGQVKIGLVRSYLGLDKYPEAMKSLEAAEAAKADPVDLHTFKGAYYLEINENDMANQELEKALELKSQNPYTYYFAGIVNLRLGHPQDAVKLFRTYLDMAPYTPEAEHAKFLIDTLC